VCVLSCVFGCVRTSVRWVDHDTCSLDVTTVQRLAIGPACPAGQYETGDEEAAGAPPGAARASYLACE
jgi:hypothetical protein